MSLSNAKRQPQSPDSRCCQHHAKIAVEICGGFELLADGARYLFSVAPEEARHGQAALQ